MSVPKLKWTQSGVVVPAEADVLSGTQDDINQAFGGNLNPALETPQGQLATSLAEEIAAKNAEIANITNQVNPDLAAGRWQDAIGRIYFLSRIPAQGTVVQATANGLPGTVIASGALAKDGNGNLWEVTTPATINSNGTASVAFTSQPLGPIAVPAELSIYQAIPGWDSIAVVSGVVGRDVESRSAFEARRRAAIALNAKGYAAAIHGAVLNLDGVLSAYAISNYGSGSKTVGGYTLAPHSVYVAVVGGTDAEVANAIWLKNSMGCDYNGNTTVTVVDDSIGSDPLPQYNIKFERPADLPIYYAVTIKADSSLPTDIDSQIQTAIENALSGADGKPAAQIGSTVYASRFYSGIALLGVEIIDILIGTSSGSETANTVAVNIDQMPTFGGQTVTQQ